MPLLCVQRKTPDDGQRNCPKHVEFYSKNKFEKLVYLVSFITRIRQVGIKQNVRLRDVIQSAKNPRLVGQIDKRWRLIGLQSRD